MKAPVVFPYPTLADGGAVLSVKKLRLDGTLRPDWVRPEETAVTLYEHVGTWRRAELELDLICPAAEVAKFEADHGPLSAVVVAHCLPTNSREQVRLTRSPTDAGRWTGTLEADRDNYLGRAGLTATLTATVGGVPHRPVAAANGWSVHFDEPETFRLGKALPVKWHDFRRSDAPQLAQAFKESSHVVAFDRPLPTLFLNTAFAGLEGLLKDRKDRKGSEKALHDLLRTGIARSVWLTLFRDALAEVTPAQDGGDTPPAWPETPWRAEVLRHILPEVVTGKSDAEMLQMVLDQWQQPRQAGDLFARAEAVIGDVVKANELLRRFVQKNAEESIKLTEDAVV